MPDSLTMVVVDDVDAVFARAQQAGVRIEFPPTDVDYGQHEFGARNLDGDYWSFATTLTTRRDARSHTSATATMLTA